MSRINKSGLALAPFIAVGCLLAGCSHAPVKAAAEGPPAASTALNNPPDIETKDISFDPVGSDSGKITGLRTVHFDFDKSALTPETRTILHKDADWIKAHPDYTLEIQGHCDRWGSVEYNLALGERRATSVKKFLQDLGVSADRMTTISYGKEKLLNLAETAAADAANRRANFSPIQSPSNRLGKVDSNGQAGNSRSLAGAQ